MIIVSIMGHGRKSGKTITVEAIVQELTKRGFSVTTIKKISKENFSIDKKGKDSYRHAKAGSKLVATASSKEIAIIKKISKENPVKEAIKFISLENPDFLIIEGRYEKSNMKILAARSYEEAKELLSKDFLFISSLTPEKFPSELKVLHPLKDAKKMADMIISLSQS